MSIISQLAEQQSSFKKQAPASDNTITGVSVPVSLDRNGSKLRLYIQLSPDVLANQQTLTSALDQLETLFDLDTWSPSGSANQTGFKKSNNYRRY